MVQPQDLQPEAQSDLDLAPQDTEFAGEAGGHEPSFIITVDGINYPCTRWETVSGARVLERRYDRGFTGGIGIFSESIQARPDQLYAAVNVDVSTHPYIRLLPRRISTDLSTGGSVSGANPTYMFVAEDTNGDEYLFVLNGRYAKKVYLHEPGGSLLNTLASTKDFGATALCGRPVLFESKWRIPLGDAVTATTLTTVSDGGGGDTYTAFTGGEKALHFAIGMQEGVAQISRAHSTNLISASASADTPAFGDTFEVGDSSLAISDLLSFSGELFVAKPDAPYRFSNDGGGNTFAIMEFVSKQKFLSGYTGDDGANSSSHGTYAYWTSSSGIWRIIGDNARPVDPMSEPLFSGFPFDSHADSGPVTGMTLAYYGRWLSVDAYGRWIYGTEASSGLWHGYIRDDGTIRWLGNLFSGQGTSKSAISRVSIVATSTAPILYTLDSASTLFRIDLQEDGSVRKITDPGTDRGGDDEVSLVIAPETNLGEPEKLKRISMMWVNTDDMASALAIRCMVYRDRSATPTRIGSDITAGGKQEVSTTPGTSDTFTDCHPALELDTGTFAEATEDPRIRAWGIRAVTPHVYRVTIPLDAEGLRGYSLGVKDALKKLRDLKSGEGVTVREPGYQSGTFTGYILDVQEKAKAMPGGRVDYVAEVLIQRWIL